MRIMPDYNFSLIETITSNSTNPLFPALNLLELDPAVVWRAASFSAAITLVFDFASAQNVNKIWLNNANFTTATIQANATDSWTAPAVTKDVTLAKDDLGICRGYFELSNTDYRYVRLVIPVQTLLSGTVPELGNVIIGEDLDFSPVAEFNSEIVDEYYTFISDSGRYFKNQRYTPRHVLSLAFANQIKAAIDALPLSGWATAIIFSDLSDVAEAYLVYPPVDRRKIILNPLDCSLSFTLEELV